MKVSVILVAGLLTGASATALACDLPALVDIPKDAKSHEQEVRTSVQAYFDQMKVYTACVQQQLTDAGGDNAQKLTKAVLVARNNAAVAEVEAVMKIFNAALAGGDAAAPGAEKPADEHSRRRH
jgi:site-specific recombinase